MEIEKITIKSLFSFYSDITSVHDASPQFMVTQTEVTAHVSIRNGDAPSFEMTIKIPNQPSVQEATEFIENLLFELH